jgi:hypothetical protein
MYYMLAEWFNGDIHIWFWKSHHYSAHVFEGQQLDYQQARPENLSKEKHEENEVVGFLNWCPPTVIQ